MEHSRHLAVVQVIDRVPAIDSSSTEGLRPAAVRGEVRHMATNHLPCPDYIQQHRLQLPSKERCTDLEQVSINQI